MKKKVFALLLSTVLAFGMMTGCGKEEEAVSSEPTTELVSIEIESESEEVVEEVVPENSYRSELTNEWISLDIENQRPVAIMVDNEKTAAFQQRFSVLYIRFTALRQQPSEPRRGQ